MRVTETYTIEQFIRNSSDIITYDNLSIIDKMNSGDTMVIYNVLNDYMDDLLDKALDIQLTAEDKIRYTYKPKLLAYDVYGATELYFIILLMNNICDVREFNMDTVKLLKKEDLIDMLSLIYNSENPSIIKNREKNA